MASLVEMVDAFAKAGRGWLVADLVSYDRMHYVLCDRLNPMLCRDRDFIRSIKENLATSSANHCAKWEVSHFFLAVFSCHEPV